MRYEINLETGETIELPDIEIVPPTPEQQALLDKQKQAADLAATDQWMSRGTEDTVVILISKGLAQKSDYSPVFIDRINYRRSLRGQPPI